MASQYVSQVTNDLEHNLKEQERVTAEITALQEQLAGLQHDHTILLSMQQALGVAAPAGGAVVPAPRNKSGDTQHAGTRRGSTRGGSTQRGGTQRTDAKKPAAKKGASAKSTPKKAASEATAPTLIELVRRYLSEQSEPRSAAEVTEALGQAHPDRGVQTKVVRTTLENLVARNCAQRTKQGSSVFYTMPEEPAKAPAKEPDTVT
ncbi:hypothetical protein ACF073_22260 [Streptomyces sp. NPDC015171]|uniref:hypothetical protein n=1 Tax=Streptomyces sp. NPDC015171 TaxID=3364945 RepID=UPI0037027509